MLNPPSGRPNPRALLSGRSTASPFQATLWGVSTAAFLAGTVCSCNTTDKTARGLSDGPRIYAAYCRDCHGPDGANDRAGEAPRMRLHGMTLTESEIVSVIADGRGGMPALKTHLSNEQIQTVSRYVSQWKAKYNAP